MTPEEFRAAGHRLIDWIADYRARAESLPVMARTGPGDVRRQLPARPPDGPEPFDAILRDLDEIIVPGLSHWQHPRFFGYFPCNGSLSSVLGDYVSTGLGVLGLAWQSSPALTELEEVVTDWMRGMLGLSEAWSGVIQDTASTSTLVALICARERTTGFSLSQGGLQAQPRPLVVYTSAHSHSSVEKAALLAGFGRANVRVVPHDVDRAGSDCRDCRARRASWLVAARGRRDGRLGDDPARVPADVERHRARRLARCQPAQVAGRGVRLLGLLRARRGASGASDVDQPELPAVGGRRPREEFPRLGCSARAPVQGAQAVVSDSRTGRVRAAGAAPPRSRQRAVAVRPGARGRRVAAARTGPAADALHAARACRRRN